MKENILIIINRTEDENTPAFRGKPRCKDEMEGIGQNM